MFARVSLITASTPLSHLFDASKTYLLIMAQGYENHSLNLLHEQATIYTVVVPAIFWKTTLYRDAFLCCELSSHENITFCSRTTQGSCHLLEDSNTLLVFVNWLDAHIYRYLDKLFSLTHENVTIMGVGCGQIDGVPKAILSRNGKALHDGFLIASSHKHSCIETGHGAKFHDGYFIAHTQDGNHIMTINGENAFEFYANMLKHHFNEELSVENIFEMGLKYPFGISSTLRETPLRIPVSVHEGAIVVSGPIDEDSTLCLMKSTPHELMKASVVALETIKTHCPHLEEKSSFIIECMGRQSVLGKDFQQELDVIASELQATQNTFGVLSLGEIANNANQYIEYFNESCVIGLFDVSQ